MGLFDSDFACPIAPINPLHYQRFSATSPFTRLLDCRSLSASAPRLLSVKFTKRPNARKFMSSMSCNFQMAWEVSEFVTLPAPRNDVLAHPSD